ncbi:MAG: BamA/TamA family outer membrane protein [bacterium]
MIKYIRIVLFGYLAVISINIAQEDQIDIRSVNISGNESINKKELMPLLRQRPSNFSFTFKGTSFNNRLLKMDGLTLKNYFISKGFLMAEVNESAIIDGNSADIYFEIIEGKQFFVSNVFIEGNLNLSKEKIQKILNIFSGEPFNSVLLNERVSSLQKELEKHSKLFSIIEIEPIIGDSVIVNISISEGEDVFIKDTYIEGVDSNDNNFVKRELLYKNGDRYNPKKVEKSKMRLKETGIYSLINITPVKVSESDSLVNLILTLSEYKQREWLSVGGFEPIEFYEGLDPLPSIGGFVEWRNRSIFNTNSNFSTKFLIGFPWETNFNLPRLRYDIGFDTNWIFGIRWPTKLNSFYETLINYDEENIDRVERYGLEMLQIIMFDNRSYFQNITVWENFSDNNVSTLDSTGLINNVTSIKNLQQRSLSFRLHIDKKDDPLFPKNGYLLDLYLKSTGYLLGGERDYLKLDFSINNYFMISKNSVLASRFKLGRIWSWEDSYNDYSYEKFYLGGSANMRGWEILKYSTVSNLGVTPFGGTHRFLSNIEFRNQMNQNLGITLFFDGGILGENFNEMQNSRLGWDIGIGLTISTPLGPVRLDYAVPYINDEMNLSNGKINFGVQYLF